MGEIKYRMTKAAWKASEWLYAGGGGLETAKGDEKSLTVTFWGLVAVLIAYEEFLAEAKLTPLTPQKRRGK